MILNSLKWYRTPGKDRTIKDKTKERKAPFVKNYAKASREAEYEIFNEEKPILIDWFFVIF